LQQSNLSWTLARADNRISWHAAGGTDSRKNQKTKPMSC